MDNAHYSEAMTTTITLTATDTPDTFDITLDGTALVMHNGTPYRVARIERVNVDGGSGPTPTVVVRMVRQTRTGRDFRSGSGQWLTLEHFAEAHPSIGAKLSAAWDAATNPGSTAVTTNGGVVRPAVTPPGHIGGSHLAYRPTSAEVAPHPFRVWRGGRSEATAINYNTLPDGDLKRLGITAIDRWSTAIDDYVEVRLVP